MIIGKFLGIVVLLLSLIISFLIIIKIVKAKNKFIRIVSSVLIFLVIITVMSSLFVSSVNFICKFDTAESAFRFNHSEEIVDIVDGKSSCMVIYKKNKNTMSVYYLYKSDANYKIPHSFSSRTVKSILNTNIGLSVDRVIQTGDHYIHGLAILNECNDYISNNKNDSFDEFILVSNMNNVKTIFIYDYIDNYETDDYYLIINDEKINITNAGT